MTELEFVKPLPIARHDASIIHCTAGSIVVDVRTTRPSHGDNHQHGRTRNHLPTNSSGAVIPIDRFNCDLYSQNAVTKSERVTDLNVTSLPLIAKDLQKTKVGAFWRDGHIRGCDNCLRRGVN